MVQSSIRDWISNFGLDPQPSAVPTQAVTLRPAATLRPAQSLPIVVGDQDDDPEDSEFDIESLRDDHQERLSEMIQGLIDLFDDDHQVKDYDAGYAATNLELRIWQIASKTDNYKDYKCRINWEFERGKGFEETMNVELDRETRIGEDTSASFLQFLQQFSEPLNDNRKKLAMRKTRTTNDGSLTNFHANNILSPEEARRDAKIGIAKAREAQLNSEDIPAGLHGMDIERRQNRRAFVPLLQDLVSLLPAGHHLSRLDVVGYAAALETDIWERAGGDEKLYGAGSDEEQKRYTEDAEEMETTIQEWNIYWETDEGDEVDHLTGFERFEKSVCEDFQGTFIQHENNDGFEEEITQLGGSYEDTTEESAESMSDDSDRNIVTKNDGDSCLSTQAHMHAGPSAVDQEAGLLNQVLEVSKASPINEQGNEQRMDAQSTQDWSVPPAAMEQAVTSPVPISQGTGDEHSASAATPYQEHSPFPEFDLAKDQTSSSVPEFNFSQAPASAPEFDFSEFDFTEPPLNSGIPSQSYSPTLGFDFPQPPASTFTTDQTHSGAPEYDFSEFDFSAPPASVDIPDQSNYSAFDFHFPQQDDFTQGYTHSSNSGFAFTQPSEPTYVEMDCEPSHPEIAPQSDQDMQEDQYDYTMDQPSQNVGFGDVAMIDHVPEVSEAPAWRPAPADPTDVVMSQPLDKSIIMPTEEAEAASSESDIPMEEFTQTFEKPQTEVPAPDFSSSISIESSDGDMAVSTPSIFDPELVTVVGGLVNFSIGNGVEPQAAQDTHIDYSKPLLQKVSSIEDDQDTPSLVSASNTSDDDGYELLMKRISNLENSAADLEKMAISLTRQAENLVAEASKLQQLAEKG